MKHILWASILILSSCRAEELYKIKYGDISQSGEFLNPKLIHYAKVTEGTFEGKYYIGMTASPAKLKFQMDGNTPKLEMELSQSCKVEFGKVNKVVVRFNTVMAYVNYNDTCNPSANLAAVVVNIDGKTQTVKRISIATTASGESNSLIFLSNR